MEALVTIFFKYAPCQRGVKLTTPRSSHMLSWLPPLVLIFNSLYRTIAYIILCIADSNERSFTAI